MSNIKKKDLHITVSQILISVTFIDSEHKNQFGMRGKLSIMICYSFSKAIVDLNILRFTS
jgi:hypothetical protein